jgi:Flp pilus assembly protein TadD
MRTWAVMFAIVVVGVCVFWNSLGAPFIWDDNTAIVNNGTIRSVWPLSDSLSPPLETPVAARPVANLSLAVNYAAGELAVQGYHAWNLAVHIGCALLLFGIVRRTIATVNSRWPADGLASAAALLWLVHPLNSEVVNYTTQRTESMMGLFFLLTLYSAIRARRSKRESRWTALAILSCALGMGTKESMVTAPLIVVLYDRLFEFDSFGDALRSRKLLYTGLAATWLELAALMMGWPRSTVGTTEAVGPWTYLLNQVEMITRYLRLTFWPGPLVLDYGLPRMLTLRDVIPGAIVLVALLAGTLLVLFRWPRMGFLGAAFFITLAPMSSVVPVLSEVGAERRMYLPLAALIVLVVVLVQLVVDRLSAGSSKRSKRLLRPFAAAVAIVVLSLGVRTVYRNAEYNNPVSLWQSSVEARPQGRARMLLAAALIADSRRDEAIAELRQAVTDFPDARSALGTELFFLGQFAEAAASLDAFVRTQPSNLNRVPFRILLAQARQSLGDLAEAESQFRAVLALDPSNKAAQEGLLLVAIAHRKKAERLLREREAKVLEATEEAKAALRLNDQDFEAHNVLGVALASQGRIGDAIEEFRRALSIKPDDGNARSNLARALAIVNASNR